MEVTILPCAACGELPGLWVLNPPEPGKMAVSPACHDFPVRYRLAFGSEPTGEISLLRGCTPRVFRKLPALLGILEGDFERNGLPLERLL